MKSTALAITLIAAASASRVQHLRKGSADGTIPGFYHSSDKIHEELVRISQSCNGMTFETKSDTDSKGEGRQIDVVTIRSPDATPTNRMFVLFGEHARELISPESGLHFVKTLCGETDLGKERAQEILKDSEFQIVVNGNPNSRRNVEGGDFCLRVSPTGVDLNRNWDEHWDGDASMGPDTNPGPSAFSEPETRIFKQLVTDYKPTTFLTIHSGTRGMYMPWAFDMNHLAKRNEPQMMEILKTVDKQHCQCPFGAAGREVGYSCPGTCLDWVYDEMKADYAFAFEIFIDPSLDDGLKERFEQKMAAAPEAFYQQSANPIPNLADDHFKEIFEAHPSGFVQLKSETHSGLEPDECFMRFNPSDADTYRSVTENWSGAYLDMASLIVKNLQTKPSNSTGAHKLNLADMGI